MKWMFWRNERQEERRLELSRLAEQLGQVNDRVVALGEGIDAGRQEIEDLAGQMTKLARLQYKTGQETQVNLDKLHKDMNDQRCRQVEFEQTKADNNVLLQQRNMLVEAMLAQLDEMDVACGGLQSGNDEWRTLLEQWIGRVTRALAALGVYELEVVGKSFNPHSSEAVGTISRVLADNGIPYEVVSVMRRGFANGDGAVFRKAQVITYKEHQDE